MLTPLEQFGRFTHFALTALPAALLAWRRPAELWRQLYLILLGAIPLGLIAGLALGFVTWIHLHGVVDPMVREKVPEYVALAVVLEFSLLKTIVLGDLVAVTGWYFGMEATGGTEGVGKAATRGVVVSIFLVLIANVFLVKLIEMVS